MKRIDATIKSLRNPFRAVRLPLAARVYRQWDVAEKKRLFYRKFLRKIYKSMVSRGMAGKGVMNFHIDGRNIPIEFNSANTLFHAVYNSHQEPYEPEIGVLIDALLKEEDVFYDIGANFGFFSFYAASKPGFKGRIYSFEPNPPVFEDLQAMVTGAGLDGVIHPYNVGIGSAKGQCHFDASTVMNIGHSKVVSEATDKSILVDIERLDDMNIPYPDLMKIDVEGFEAEVLKSSEKIISSHHPVIIFESWYSDEYQAKWKEPLEILERYGYLFYFPEVHFKDDRISMSLQEFRAEDRTSLKDGGNILALPSDKIGLLDRI